jgi:hypothetical protein
MASQNSNSESDYSAEKLRLEIEKLKLENELMNKSVWKTPTFYAVFIPLLISIVFNIFQMVHYNKEEVQRKNEFKAQKEKLDEEIKHLKNLAEVSRRTLELDDKKLAESEAASQQLAQVNRNIEITEQFLLKSQLTLQKEQAELATGLMTGEIRKGGSKQEADKKNIEISTNSIKYYEEELAGYRERKRELEALLK